MEMGNETFRWITEAYNITRGIGNTFVLILQKDGIRMTLFYELFMSLTHIIRDSQ